MHPVRPGQGGLRVQIEQPDFTESHFAQGAHTAARVGALIRVNPAAGSVGNKLRPQAHAQHRLSLR